MEILEFIGSVKELNDICEKWGNPSFDESNDFFSSEISKKIRSYDDSFFVDNTLIIYSFLRGQIKSKNIKQWVQRIGLVNCFIYGGLCSNNNTCVLN